MFRDNHIKRYVLTWQIRRTALLLESLYFQVR